MSDKEPKTMEKTARFMTLLRGDRHFSLMEAHNGLSAQIVEEAGFPAIWASGLTITASLGVRDNNEISYTQFIDMLEYMNNACSIPILVDGDTGYGNFNNARVFVNRLERRGIAAVCIEDKVFPKTNSFLENRIDALAKIDEFTGKIKAIKDAQLSPEFSLIARLEALIVGAGNAEALKRAYAYMEAGADALLVHSKKQDGGEIYEFLRSFEGDIPIFLVPTKYYSEPVEKLTADRRVRGLIWANHNLRAGLMRMRQLCAKIRADGTVANIEDSIAPISDIFEFQGNREYMEAEAKYLPRGKEFKACVLAAAGGMTDMRLDIPKSVIPINGRTILERQVATFRANAVNDITIVAGYMKEKIPDGPFAVLENSEWRSTGVVHSLALALAGDTDTPRVVSFGDVFFKRHLLREMLEREDCDLVIACVREDYIKNGYALKITIPMSPVEENLESLIADVLPGNAHEGDDVVYFSGIMVLNNIKPIAKILSDNDTRKMGMSRFFQLILREGMKAGVLFTSTNSVVDVNSAKDMLRASGLE